MAGPKRGAGSRNDDDSRLRRAPLTDEWKKRTAELLEAKFGYGWQTRTAEEAKISVKTVQAILSVKPGGRRPVLSSAAAQSIAEVAEHPLPYTLRDEADDELSSLVADARRLPVDQKRAAVEILRVLVRGQQPRK